MAPGGAPNSSLGAFERSLSVFDRAKSACLTSIRSTKLIVQRFLSKGVGGSPDCTTRIQCQPFSDVSSIGGEARGLRRGVLPGLGWGRPLDAVAKDTKPLSDHRSAATWPLCAMRVPRYRAAAAASPIYLMGMESIRSVIICIMDSIICMRISIIRCASGLPAGGDGIRCMPDIMLIPSCIIFWCSAIKA